MKLLAAVALACAALYTPLSHAIALGQLRVLSGLGEPLLAEIDVPQISPEELAAFDAALGTPAEFEAAGMAYHPSLRDTVLSAQRRPDGRAFLRLTGLRPINEPFIELIVGARGGARPVVRDYTLVFESRAPRGAGNTPIALGQARVLSARGEPLRAEIDVPQLGQGQVTGARVAVASAADFQAVGLAYHPSLRDLRMSFQRRPDGRTFMSVTSDQPFNEASLDLILEASSASGRTVRDYSVPIAAPAVASARVSSGPVTPAAPAPAPATVAPQAPAPVAVISPIAVPAAVIEAVPVPAAVAVTAPAAPPVGASPPAPELPAIVAALTPSPTATPPAAPVRQVKVRAGDTLSRIARANKPADISLDQMLIALLRANPDAFVDNNVNRLKAGAELNIPAHEQAAAVAPDEAASVLVLQSRDFEEYRHRLATDALRMASTSRQASGKIEATVSEKKPAAPSRNRLTLSAGAVGRVSADEKGIAARLARVAEERAVKLSNEIDALSRLQGPGPGATPAAAPSTTAAASQASAGPAAPPASAANPAAAVLPGR